MTLARKFARETRAGKKKFASRELFFAEPPYICVLVADFRWHRAGRVSSTDKPYAVSKKLKQTTTDQTATAKKASAKLSTVQAHALRALAAGANVTMGKRTIAALCNRGYTNSDGRITPKGRAWVRRDAGVEAPKVPAGPIDVLGIDPAGNVAPIVFGVDVERGEVERMTLNDILGDDRPQVTAPEPAPEPELTPAEKALAALPADFRPIPEFDHRYGISTAGDVYSVRAKRVIKRVVKMGQTCWSHRLVDNTGRDRWMYTHRLVAMAWSEVQPLPEGTIVRFLNGDSMDPVWSNLTVHSPSMLREERERRDAQREAAKVAKAEAKAAKAAAKPADMQVDETLPADEVAKRVAKANKRAKAESKRRKAKVAKAKKAAETASVSLIDALTPPQMG